MKAVVIRKFGGPEVLEAADLAVPAPAPDEVLVRVRACALNHLDLWVRQGIPDYKVTFPHVLGSDVAGEIAALGAQVSGFKVGLRVAVSPGRSCLTCDFCLAGQDNQCPEFGAIGVVGPGGYAEYLRVPPQYLLPIPESLSFEEAACFPLTFLTAWHMLRTMGDCSPGQTVLVLGAGSGVGVAAIQIAKLSGARVIASSTSSEKLAKARSLGADAVIHHPPQNLLFETGKLTGGKMADIVIDHVGLAVFNAGLKCLKPGGRLVTCGATTGPTVTLDLRYVFSRQLKILGARLGTTREMRDVWRLLEGGRLRPIVDACFPLEEARTAHEYLAARRQFGKVVLTLS